MNHSETIQKLQLHCGPNAHPVMKVTGLREDQLSEIILYAGLQFIAEFEPGVADRMAKSAPFWSWFKMYWYSLDAEFVKVYHNIKVSADFYKDHHLERLRVVYPDRCTLIAIKKSLKEVSC